MDAVAQPTIGLGRQAWNFARHFLEMCIAMCVGGMALSVLVFAGIPALIGGGDLRELYPELSLLVIAVFLTVPMAGWMRFRGMDWRPILEMSAVAIGLALFLIGLVWIGQAPETTLQIGVGRFCGMACIGMFAIMLFRLDMYTGRNGHAGHHRSAGVQAAPR